MLSAIKEEVTNSWNLNGVQQQGNKLDFQKQGLVQNISKQSKTF